MDKFTEKILTPNNVICQNIEKREILEDDGLLAQNVLSQLRNYVEAIILKLYSLEHNADFGQESKKQAVKYIKSKDEFVFLKRLHRRLEVTDSHSTVEPEAALRLLWRYYDDLLLCRELLKTKFNLETLTNLDLLPLEEDETLKDYYNKISIEINKWPTYSITESPTHRFYIHKKKSFRVNGKKYYELTISEADNKTTKFDRIIAFTQIDIPVYYAVHLKFKSSKINIINRDMPVSIIVGFKVSTRPCEFDNYFKLLGHITKIGTKDAEYRELMTYLSQTGRNLTDFLEFDEDDFSKIRNKICKDIKSTPIFDGLLKVRHLYNKPGYNILTYLLYRLNNKVLRNQFDRSQNEKLSFLYLKYKCIPFDKMPFASNLPEHNSFLSDLFDCIDVIGREHELLGRKIRINTEINAQLYTPLSELNKFQNIEKLIETYNSKLYYKHVKDGSLKLEDGFVFLSGYENNSVYIIQQLLSLSKEKIIGYTDSVNDWLEKSAYVIDDATKQEILQKLFEQSKVALIYGSAGTGKSTMISHISNFFRNNKKIYLANTHAAVENLHRNIGESENNNFSTIKGFIEDGGGSCDILFVDECSTVSNQDMADILKKTNYKLLVLVGDIYQIESIKFGNWFYIAKSSLPENCIYELSYIHRSTEPDLLLLWNAVRTLDDRIPDIMELHNFCSTLNDGIFEKEENDEIVLCLNYDGLYGINNLNKFLQDNQPGDSVQIGLEKYKVGDPIVFKENDRYGKYLYNNLKGTILKIEKYDGGVKFTLEVNIVFNSLSVEHAPFTLEEPVNKGKSVISLKVGKFVNNDDEDRTDDNIVPFQVSYAVSIHKAQGLEYDSVKIIITDEVEELISHNIFYTAITRAKHKLKVYWTKNAEENILNNMHFMFNKQDSKILLKKFNLK